MDELGAGIYLLALLLAVVAFVYSSVGLAGGSSYTALLAVTGINYLAIPTISLLLNLFVSTAGSINFIIHRHARPQLILPFLVSSIPMAYLGGSLHLPKIIFLWVLWVSLIFVAIRIYLFDKATLKLALSDTQKIIISVFAGMILGLIAGIVGIGGGVYLVPLIIILGLGSAKEAAACGVIFIFVNSASGLLARIQHQPVDILAYWPLIIAVLIGGISGSYLGARHYSTKSIEKILGLIILLAIILLGKKLVF